MKGTTLTITLTSLVVAFSVSAAGMNSKWNNGSAPQQPVFSQIDVDGDKLISSQELIDFKAQRISERAEQGRRLQNISRSTEFGSYDSDGDGFISEDEFTAHKNSARAAMQNGRQGNWQNGMKGKQGFNKGQRKGNCQGPRQSQI
ncbi:EF-hand domain-containing protein [Vibrio sp. SCSIO 43137]|uniref:EF-hand domain-containing protein n=1 Tax=Vibrio sp. SCSIO 43137 TaxID=3021011 RepID=UPI002307159E|nr:EF-hand domain-containing protein [Vibrio sp. SCSIO 43137]WCE31673.1 EF-hand domain-containing protein [Vibrio sp. SCSIO 43137]